MNFLHLSLLAGLGAMAIPIALHLLSRRQPKLLPFPALRFVKQTVVQQRGSWQLRHFLLLLLRVGMFAAMAVAMARPRVHSAMLTTALGLGLLVSGAIFASIVALVAGVTRRGPRLWLPVAMIAVCMWVGAATWTAMTLTSGPIVPSSDQTAPVAAAVIIDTGPSLEYRSDNTKRIVAAKEMSAWILGKLPVDSRVGVLTNAPLGSLSLDPATAKGQIEVLQGQSGHVDLAARIRTALDLVLAAGLERKEVYVVTDLVRSSWSGATPELASLLKEHSKDVLIQIIDVGATRITNWRLGDLETESQVVPQGGDAQWQVTVTRTAQTPGGSASVELYQEKIDPSLPIVSNGELKLPPSHVIDRQEVDLTQVTDARVALSARNLTPGSHNFQIKLTIADPLESDNVRYATVVCEAQQSALVVSDDAEVSRIMRLALAPTATEASADGDLESGTSQEVRYNRLAQVDLERYGVIWLNDPPPLPPATVAMLENRVKRGGGLFIALGPAVGTPDEVMESPMRPLLPGKLARISRRSQEDDSLFLVSVSSAHPLFSVYGSMASDVPWNRFPIHRAWEMEEVRSDVQTLMVTSERALPAVLLERLGNGQILTLITPLPDKIERNHSPWNKLTSNSDPWPAFGLILGAVRMLSGQTQSRYNFMSGESIFLNNDPKVFPLLYELYSPRGDMRRVEATNEQVSLSGLDQAGTYRMRALQGSAASRGVSINTPTNDTVLDRMESKDLDSLLGSGNYRLARDVSEVESSVGQARHGRELFPLLMACVAAIFLAEQAMSNRFYKLPLAPVRT